MALGFFVHGHYPCAYGAKMTSFLCKMTKIHYLRGKEPYIGGANDKQVA